MDGDLIAGRDYIRADNERAALDFLDNAFEAFDLLARSPKMGPRVRLRHHKMRNLRFFVLAPTFSSWLVFCQSGAGASKSCGCFAET